MSKRSKSSRREIAPVPAPVVAAAQPRPLEVPRNDSEPSDFVHVADVIRFIRFLLRYKWGIAFCALLGVGAGYLYCQQADELFRSKSQLLVVQQRMETVAGLAVGTRGLESDVATHVAVLKSPVFLKGKVLDAGLNDLAFFQDMEPAEAVEMLAGGLAVARDSEYPESPSNILTITFDGEDPLVCQRVLESVNEAYLAFLEETSQAGSQDALARITKKADDVLKELNRKQAEYESFNRQHLEEWGDIQQGIAFYRERLADVRSKQLDFQLERSQLAQQLTGFRNDVDKVRTTGGDLEKLLELTPEFKSLSKRSELNQYLVPLLIEQQQLLKRFGKGHHRVQELQEKIAYTREYFATGQINDQGEEPPSVDEAIAKYERSMQEKIAVIDSSYAALESIAKEESGKIKELTELELKAKQYATSIAQSEKYYDSLIAQIQGVQFSQGMQGVQASPLLPPTVARQVAPNIPLVMVASCCGGCLLGCLIAFARHLNDHSFRDAGEVRSSLGLPVVGHIPTFETRAIARRASKQGCSRLVRAFHQPDSVYAEAYRGLRTSLFFAIPEEHQTIQVVSPTLGDGKSVLLANLAVSIVYSGKSVLILDADMRRPSVHELFDCDNSIGLSSVLLGDAELADCIQDTAVSQLSVLPSGPVPDSPADLLFSARFTDLLENLKLQFDYILIDSPPLLPVTDGRVVATRADGVLLLVQMEKNNRPQAEKAKQILQDLQAYVYGVVLRSSQQSEFAFYKKKHSRTPASKKGTSKLPHAAG